RKDTKDVQTAYDNVRKHIYEILSLWLYSSPP
ncbi:unnamed protein product, partial [marine sediment metagenome]